MVPVAPAVGSPLTSPRPRQQIVVSGLLSARTSVIQFNGIEFRELIALMLILSVLLVRPAGLFGEIVTRRV